jgi:glycosyltransferase involved in cell wall biosynthesis
VKVLHVIPSISPELGGPSLVVISLVQALRDLGIEAEIVTTNDNAGALFDIPLNQKVDYKGVPIWFLPRFEPPLKEFIFSTALTGWLWQNLREYQLIHNHYLFSYAPTCAAVIARHFNLPYIIRPIGQLEPWALNQSQWKKKIYTFLIEHRNLQKASAIHCTSKREAEDVRHFGIQTPTITLPLGVKMPPYISQAKLKLRQQYNINPDVPIVLFLSRLHKKKRPDLLIESLSQLARKDYNFHLVLAGSGELDYLNYLKKLVSSLGLSDQTSFTGFVSGVEKDLVLQGSDLFVLPSFSENFGVAIAEAMAAGLPVVLTPGIQISEEVAAADAGLVVEGEVEPLASAIAQLLTSVDLREKMGQKGKQLVRDRYSWEGIAQELIKHYSAIIK